MSFGACGSKRKRHPCIKELPDLLVIDDRIAGDERTVSKRKSQIAGDLPVQVDVGLKTEESRVGGVFVDGRIVVLFPERKHIAADLEAADGTDVGEWKRGCASAQDNQIGNCGRERQARVEQAEGVEGLVGRGCRRTCWRC